MVQALFTGLDPLLFGITFSSWCLVLIIERIIVLIKGKRLKRTKKDRGTYYLVYVCTLVSIIISFIMGSDKIMLLPAVAIYPGILMILTGTIIREYAVYSLGKYFNYQVSVSEEQEIIETGLFKYIRHPSYTGLILALLGISMSFRSVAAMLLVLGLIIVAFGLRIKFEEELFTRELGSKYNEYKTRTKRIIPYVL